jgi:hypothetical protein
VGARNATYKVLCPTTNISINNCPFYNLLDDPLEEDPITTAEGKPTSCAQYENGTWQPSVLQWHYCRLLDVISDYSILPSFPLP